MSKEFRTLKSINLNSLTANNFQEFNAIMSSQLCQKIFQKKKSGIFLVFSRQQVCKPIFFGKKLSN